MYRVVVKKNVGWYLRVYGWNDFCFEWDFFWCMYGEDLLIGRLWMLMCECLVLRFLWVFFLYCEE